MYQPAYPTSALSRDDRLVWSDSNLLAECDIHSIDRNLSATAAAPRRRSAVVFSGGSGFSPFVDMLQVRPSRSLLDLVVNVPFLQGLTNRVSYVMPVSDDGGSTSEIVRVLGGPGIGDIRSRLLGLVDRDNSARKLLSYRLPTSDASVATMEWMQLVAENHPLWIHVPIQVRPIIRSFLLHFFEKSLSQLSLDTPAFDFRGACVGNLFLTGARIFFGSLEAAIHTFTSVIGYMGHAKVIPIIATSSTRVGIAATLEDGTCIYGQCEISHPSSQEPLEQNDGIARTVLQRDSKTSIKTLVSDTPGLPRRKSNLFFNKSESCTSLPSRIHRVFYTDGGKREVAPVLNPLVETQLRTTGTILYAMGSLYTSLIPCLVVPGTGQLVAESRARKILLLNGTWDRETEGYTAEDFVQAIVDALELSMDAGVCSPPTSVPGGVTTQPELGFLESPLPSPGERMGESRLSRHPPRLFITHVLYTEDSRVPIDEDALQNIGITCIPVRAHGTVTGNFSESVGYYGAEELKEVLEMLL
ncbi:hypothetical protein BC830DRAFT_1145600 [Chytriomyces sp. MP71]|nr:hypothetical protein BC830DRAFT_1145600 [Chytriomyces sp. MP71]